jgi:UDP-N-acetylmuramyl pentapeptide phosphotransferase/UDP-N-acetylglucosamine-1-phosphate transferase
MLTIGDNPGIGALRWSCTKAFLVALVLTPIIRDIFRVYNIVDRPGLRKVHAYPIPRLGGISLIVAYLFGLHGLHMHRLLWQLVPGAAVIFGVGILDDFFNLPAGLKLLGQIAAGCIAYWTGLRVPVPAPISFPLTVFWLVLTTNAYNLVDGLDGLCAGLGFTAATALFFMGLMQGNVELECATVALAGGLLGFLCYNFSRATMFLGDSGALLIGFLIGCGGLLWSQQTGPQLSMLAPVLVIWVPMTDLLLSVVRRRLARRPIFSADRGHVHHRLLDRGLNSREAVLILYAWGTCGGAFALLLAYPPVHPWRALIIAGFFAATGAGIRQLWYSEVKWRSS